MNAFMMRLNVRPMLPYILLVLVAVACVGGRADGCVDSEAEMVRARLFEEAVSDLRASLRDAALPAHIFVGDQAKQFEGGYRIGFAFALLGDIYPTTPGFGKAEGAGWVAGQAAGMAKFDALCHKYKYYWWSDVAAPGVDRSR